MLHLTVTVGNSQHSQQYSSYLLIVAACLHSWHRPKLQIRRNELAELSSWDFWSYFILVYSIARGFNQFTGQSVKTCWWIYWKLVKFGSVVRIRCESVNCVRFLILETSFELALNNGFLYLPDCTSISETFLDLSENQIHFLVSNL